MLTLSLRPPGVHTTHPMAPPSYGPADRKQSERSLLMPGTNIIDCEQNKIVKNACQPLSTYNFVAPHPRRMKSLWGGIFTSLIF